MFHTRVLGVPSRNLDLFLQGQEGLRQSLLTARDGIAVLEGAMGYYDGMAGTEKASAWEIASRWREEKEMPWSRSKRVMARPA